MLTIVLKILSILGILLLIVLSIAIFLLLLVLFFPVTYKLKASRRPQETAYLTEVRLRANWLFGLLRVRWIYPEPGNVTAKVLWFTLFDSAKEKASQAEESTEEKTSGEGSTEEASAGEEPVREDDPSGENPEDAAASTPEEQSEEQPEKQPEGLLNKIKYTIRNICDKIKKIREDFTFYRELLLSDDTRGLMDHGFRRIGKILKSIRPRKLKADILFGTGSPDTTGYALGVYGMLSPHLNRKVNITPDFTQAVLEGELYAAGHITAARLLRHVVMFVLDKRLRQLVHKLKQRESTGQKDK